MTIPATPLPPPHQEPRRQGSRAIPSRLAEQQPDRQLRLGLEPKPPASTGYPAAIETGAIAPTIWPLIARRLRLTT